jgi:ABC-type transport system involved in multi-copper enzyme maturation permease subunit
MKALLLKEIRQGKTILLFGPCYGLLVWLLVGSLIYLLPNFTWQDVVGLTFTVGLGGTLLIALLSGAGLFAGDVDRGTLSLLLSLPLSRKRIWGGKILAGLTQGLLASGLLLLVLLPILYSQLDQNPLGDLHRTLLFWLCCWFAVFCVSLFFSALLEHTVGVILAALLACVGLGWLAGYTVLRWGGGLFGYDALSDIGLWLLLLTPAILLASLAAFCRGELLRGARKWLLALPTFLLIAGISVLLLVGSVRWAVRYSRPLVEATYPAKADWNASNIAVFALRSPARELFSLPDGDNWRMFYSDYDAYRSRNLVLLNQADGREQQIIANGLSAAFSADGKKAAVMYLPQGLTWWEDFSIFTRGRRIEIFDLAAKKALADFAPEAQWGKGLGYLRQEIFLSPGGSWLACNVFQEQPPHYGLIVSDVAGNKISQIELLTPGAWAWGAEERGIYSIDASGRLIYSPLPTGASQILWQGREVLPYDFDQIKQIQLALSSDGRWLALQISGRVLGKGEKDQPEFYRGRLWTYVISREGRPVYLLQQEQGASKTESLVGSKPVWSPDSSRLYYLSGRVNAVSGEFGLWLWRVGDKTPRVSPLPSFTENKLPEIAFRPKTDDLLIWDKKQVLLADKQGKITPFPNDKVTALAKDHALLGIDKAGRAIVLELPIGNHNQIGAVNLNTGELKQIYP